MIPNEKILILGRPETGKSCLMGQLFKSLKEQGKLYKQPQNTTFINTIIKKQAQGLNPARTTNDINEKTTFHIKLNNEKRIDVIWPDYAGEKITDIVEKRILPLELVELVEKSSVWILLIRISKLKPIDSILDRPTCNKGRNNQEIRDSFEVSDYAFFIELLQILINVKKSEISNGLKLPSLQIMLTFWDELQEEEQGKTPLELLTLKSPLLSEFLQSIWKSKISFLGLSPQEMPLKLTKSDSGKSNLESKIEDFIDSPEDFGYIIDKDGKRVEDLSFLIENAINISSL